MDVLVSRIENYFAGNARGSYTFNSFDDFFANRPASFVQAFPGANTAGFTTKPNVTELGAYFQDEFRVSPKLTLNFGLRYEYESPTTDRYNRSIRSFDFETPNPVDAQARANYAKAPIPQIPAEAFRAMGGLTFPGVNGQPRGLWTSDKNNFAPRVGVAWDPLGSGRLGLRASYGLIVEDHRTDGAAVCGCNKGRVANTLGLQTGSKARVAHAAGGQACSTGQEANGVAVKSRVR